MKNSSREAAGYTDRDVPPTIMVSALLTAAMAPRHTC